MNSFQLTVNGSTPHDHCTQGNITSLDYNHTHVIGPNGQVFPAGPDNHIHNYIQAPNGQFVICQRYAMPQNMPAKKPCNCGKK